MILVVSFKYWKIDVQKLWVFDSSAFGRRPTIFGVCIVRFANLQKKTVFFVISYVWE